MNYLVLKHNDDKSIGLLNIVEHDGREVAERLARGWLLYYPASKIEIREAPFATKCQPIANVGLSNSDVSG